MQMVLKNRGEQYLLADYQRILMYAGLKLNDSVAI